MSLNREFLIWKKSGRGPSGVRESERGGRVSRQAYLSFRKDRGERQGYREIERHRNKETELTIKIPSKAG